VSDLIAMALMTLATLIALSIIWGTYVRQYVLEAKEGRARRAVSKAELISLRGFFILRLPVVPPQ
jgi:hypothetical protein